MEFEIKKFIIPVIVFLISLFILFLNYQKTGDFIFRDVDLRGGKLIVIESEKEIDLKVLEKRLTAKYGSVFVSGLKTAAGYGVNIEVANETNVNDVLNDIKSFGTPVSSYFVETIEPYNLSQITHKLITVLILIFLCFFLFYRKIVLCFGVISATLANLLTVIAITSLFGVRIGFAGLGGLLILISYIINSNVILLNLVLDSESENFKNKYKKSLISYLTIVITIASVISFVLVLSTSKLLSGMLGVLLVGLFSDFLFTWLLNASILEIWLRKKSV